MPTLITDAARIKAALTHISKTGATKRAVMPALYRVRFEWNQEMLAMHSNNLDIQLTAIMPVEAEGEGTIDVPFPQIKAALDGKLGEKGFEITYADDEPTRIRVGRKVIEKNNELDPDDFPFVDDYSLDEPVFTVDDPRWHKVVDALAPDDSRPVLASAHVVVDGDEFRIETADGFRMAIYRGKTGSPHHEGSSILLGAALKHIPKGKGFTYYQPTDRYNILSYEIAHGIQIVSVSRIVDGTYPDLASIEPDPNAAQHIITMRPGDVQQAAVHANKYGNSHGLIKITDTSIIVPSSEVGNAVFNGYEFQIGDAEYGFNGEYLAWAVEGDDAPEVRLQSVNQPCLVIDGPVSMTIMPMVIGAN